MLIVKKFGGTSVANKERIFNVARRCIEDYKAGHDVVVVLSAMGDTTDELIELANSINPDAKKRELDMLLTTGEQVSVSLMAMAMQALDVPAVSLNAFQVAMHATSRYGNARFKRVDTKRIRHELDSRKIVIVIDEAHVFIDSKYPVALDFMYQMAKRIRKYNGMQIIITQNIKDFVGTEELARKSTAVINACQYSFIFPLSPNDMHDLCRLYEKAGAINESEQDEIINNGRGRAFVVTSPSERSSIDIETPKDIERLFGI